MVFESEQAVDRFTRVICGVGRGFPEEGVMRVLLCGLFFLLTAGLFSDPLIEMLDVEGGTFQMGNAKSKDTGLYLHKVTLSSFRMGRTEVTQAQFKAVMGVNPNGLWKR
jgi:hypothetical protein